jgi:hypothetical protein
MLVLWLIALLAPLFRTINSVYRVIQVCLFLQALAEAALPIVIDVVPQQHAQLVPKVTT